MVFEFQLSAEVNIDKFASVVKRRGLEKSGRVQQALDSVILQTCDPYIPFDTGMLRDSGILNTAIGSGEIEYNTPYARKQYYENKGGKGLQGKLWFERAKSDHLPEWGEVVENESGGRVTLF